jgi:hypothetical protein
MQNALFLGIHLMAAYQWLVYVQVMQIYKNVWKSTLTLCPLQSEMVCGLLLLIFLKASVIYPQVPPCHGASTASMRGLGWMVLIRVQRVVAKVSMSMFSTLAFGLLTKISLVQMVVSVHCRRSRFRVRALSSAVLPTSLVLPTSMVMARIVQGQLVVSIMVWPREFRCMR